MGRPKQFDPEVAVASAMDVFWRTGYGATTPAELVEAVGIGKGSLYNAFESKHALFELALRRYGDMRVEGLVGILNRPGKVRARLAAALEKLATPENAHLRRRGCMAVNAASELGGHDDGAMAIVRHVFERMEHALQRTLEEGQRTGEIDADHDPQALASLLLSTIIGMAVIGKTGERPERLRRVVRAALALV